MKITFFKNFSVAFQRSGMLHDLSHAILYRSFWLARKWIVYILLALGIGIWQTAIESSGQEAGLNPGRSISVMNRFYEWIAVAGHQKPKPRFVRIVVLSPSHEPAEIFDDTCKKREFVAALLDRIASVSPSAVVLDFWYPSEFCNDSEGGQRNRRLQVAVQRASDRFPVIIGSSTHTKRELQLESGPDWTQLKDVGLNDNDQILDPRSNFTGKHLSYGLTRIDADAQQIPTLWSVYTDKSAAVRHSPTDKLPSLAYAAAVTHDPRVAQRLIKINSTAEHAFTTITPEREFKPIHAIDLLCVNYGQGGGWRECKQPDASAVSALNSLKGKIIIISEQNTQSDLWNSVAGEIPGYLLHANYVESLLENRYLKSIPLHWEMILILVGTIVIGHIFESARGRFLRLVNRLVIFVITVGGFTVALAYVGRVTLLLFPLAAVVILAIGVLLWRKIAVNVRSSQMMSEMRPQLNAAENAEI